MILLWLLELVPAYITPLPVGELCQLHLGKHQQVALLLFGLVALGNLGL